MFEGSFLPSIFARGYCSLKQYLLLKPTYTYLDLALKCTLQQLLFSLNVHLIISLDDIDGLCLKALKDHVDPAGVVS